MSTEEFASPLTEKADQLSEEVSAANVERLPFKELVKRIGPGIVLTGVVIGPGAITTAAMIGADYGYSLVWLLIPIAFMGMTFLLTTYRISLLTGMPAIDAIIHYFGKGAGIFVGIAAFLACTFFTIGNISGTGAGMNLIFGIDWKFGALIMLCVLIYCYFSKNVYSKVEKGIMVCIFGMIIAFYATLIGTGGPDWSSVGTGLVNWTFPQGSLATALAFISTNASILTGIYGTYLGNEKKWKKDDLFNGTMKADAVSHIIGVILISGAIILVGAIVMHPTGETLTAPAQLAAMLVPSMGGAARYIMGIALVGAGFSSLLGNTQRGLVLLYAGLQKETRLESKPVQWGCMIVLAFSTVVCFLYNGSPVQLIFFANVATAIATPVAGLFIMLLLWKKDVNKGYKQPRALQICMTISYLFCLIMTVSALMNYIQKLFASF